MFLSKGGGGWYMHKSRKPCISEKHIENVFNHVKPDKWKTVWKVAYVFYVFSYYQASKAHVERYSENMELIF